MVFKWDTGSILEIQCFWVRFRIPYSRDSKSEVFRKGLLTVHQSTSLNHKIQTLSEVCLYYSTIGHFYINELELTLPIVTIYSHS